MSRTSRGRSPQGAVGGSVPSKTCSTCGRTMTWRKSWERNWDSVRYCSDACRSRRPGPAEEQLERVIIEMLSARSRDASICPSEVARAIAPDDWRPLMEPVREAARRLVARGSVVITQSGRVVDPSTASGPIRIRRGPDSTGSGRD